MAEAAMIDTREDSVGMGASDALRHLNIDLMTADELCAALQEGYEDALAGRVVDAESAFTEFRARHKL